MVVGMIAQAATATASLVTFYLLGKGSGRSDFGEEVKTIAII